MCLAIVMKKDDWKAKELTLLVLYAVAFYAFIISRSLLLSHDHALKLYRLRPGWIFSSRLNDESDAQWRNFRGNIPILTLVFALFSLLANMSRPFFGLKAKGMSLVWLSISLVYLSYLHGVCTIFILSIAAFNFFLVKIFARTKYFSFVLWVFNIFFLLCNRIYEGYSFLYLGSSGHIWTITEATLVILRMISFGYDYHWAHEASSFDRKKHTQRCHICMSGKECYRLLQERSVMKDNFSLSIYLCYLVYAPLYIAGPIISFNAFASQLDTPQKSYSAKDISWYGLRWIISFILMELLTHLFYYNAFAISGLWKILSPLDIFIIGYGVLNFMWLKFFLIWRYFRFWSLICGIEVPENMPRCVNNCYNMESFWKNWHASYNKWLVRYMYIPLGGSQRKLLSVWIIFTFVAIWHDLEWKLLSWAWLTCLFFIPEMLLKSAANALQVESSFQKFLFREFSALAGAVTITCLMVANLVGYVIGPSGVNWLISKFLSRDGLPVLGGMFLSFYVGTKIMFHIDDVKQRKP